MMLDEELNEQRGRLEVARGAALSAARALMGNLNNTQAAYELGVLLDVEKEETDKMRTLIRRLDR